MPNLFGLDIAAIVNDAIQSAGGVVPAILVRSITTDNPTDILGPPTVVERRYSCSGFFENRADEYRDGTLVKRGGAFISILGASLPPGSEPKSGDQIEIDNRVYQLSGIPNLDPAGALFECAATELGEESMTPITPVVPPAMDKPGAFSQAFSKTDFDVFVPAG